MIRPAKCHFNGFIKPSIKGADKNHNPRKGTEISSNSLMMVVSRLHDKNHNPRKGTEMFSSSEVSTGNGQPIRTIIPARGRKFHLYTLLPTYLQIDKNHNPRKGTEIKRFVSSFIIFSSFDKNHNPRKGTEIRSCFCSFHSEM